jgi:hypothetical protein
MAASTALASEDEVRAFIDEYYKAWGRTDEDHILSYYTETVSVELPGMLINCTAHDEQSSPHSSYLALSSHSLSCADR